MKNIRIETIAGIVKEGMKVADIGTDHAFLPILLVQNGTSPFVYACDVAKGPLESAKKNIQEAGLENQIQTVLSNGLQEVPEDAKVCVIAGMGYHTAEMILENAKNRVYDFEQFVIEVNKNTDLLRKWISEHNFTILDERAVYEKGHDYIIVSFSPEKHEPYTEEEIITGTDALMHHTEEYKTYLLHREEKLDMILKASAGKKSYPEYEKELAYIQKRLDLFK